LAATRKNLHFFSKRLKQNAILHPIYGRALKMCYAQIERKEYVMETATIDRPPPTGEGLTFEKVWAMFQESDRRMEEQRKEREKRDREWEKQRKETERFLKELGKQMGDLHNRFGELAEHLVVPSIAQRFNEMGFHFDSVAPGGEKIFGENGKVIAQTDILLKNSDYIVAIEVKAKPDMEDVPEHINRLGILRNYWTNKGDRRKLLGAIAGAIFPETVKKAAVKAGLFVLVQSGDTMKIEIPEGFVPREF
jgi:hypothetical protein